MKLVTIPEKCLFIKSDEVQIIDNELRLLIKEMVDVLLEAKGFGLAAPQVGINKRFFVIMLPTWKQYKVFINPEILAVMGKKTIKEEGCLSIPGIAIKVPRYERIRLSYFELDGTERVEEFKGDVARIVQHEYEHLDGILITNYI